MKTFHLFLLIIATLSINVNAQQAGTVDLTFNPHDKGYGTGFGSSTLETTAIQNDGKILIPVNYSYNSVEQNGITRINADGSIDTSFNGYIDANAYVRTISIQDDGKIIVGGDFSNYAGNVRYYVSRLNTNGSVDESFNVELSNGSVYTSAIQDDGKILIAGNFVSYGTTLRNNLVRLNADGSLDNTFIIGTGTDDMVHSIKIQNDGKILIGGKFSHFNDTVMNQIARLNINGSIDTTFHFISNDNSYIKDIEIQDNGKILIGKTWGLSNSQLRNYISRLNSDGSIDQTFYAENGIYTNVYDIAIQDDGKIIIAGTSLPTDVASIKSKFIRLNNNGTFDSSFETNNGVSGYINSISIQGNGKIIIGGYFSNYSGIFRKNIARVNSDGSHDRSFNTGGGVQGILNKIIVQDDGKIIIAGSYDSYNQEIKGSVSRLFPDGSPDFSFVPEKYEPIVNTFGVQLDGKIITTSTSYNGMSQEHLTRMNIDGSIDSTFNNSIGLYHQIKTVNIQDDGRIFIGGMGYALFSLGSNRARLACLKVDGTIDSTFNGGNEGVDGNVNDITFTQNGKILIGGEISNYNGIPRSCIVRLYNDGSLDESFIPEINPYISFYNRVYKIAAHNDGKVLIKSKDEGFCRLNIDGSLDTAFNRKVSELHISLSDMAIQENDKIIVLGEFTINGEDFTNGVLRLNYDGSLDSAYYIGKEANNSITTCAIQNDGKIIIGGTFTAYDNIGRNRIARIFGDCETFNIDVSITNGTLTVVNPTLETTYKWFDCNNNNSFIEGQTNQTFIPNTSGNYSVEVTKNGCIDTSSCMPFILVDLETTPVFSIKVCPNPTTGIFIFETNTESTIKLYDIHSKEVLILQNVIGKHKIDISNLPLGTYFLKAISRDKIEIVKIIKTAP